MLYTGLKSVCRSNRNIKKKNIKSQELYDARFCCRWSKDEKEKGTNEVESINEFNFGIFYIVYAASERALNIIRGNVNILSAIGHRSVSDIKR